MLNHIEKELYNILIYPPLLPQTSIRARLSKDGYFIKVPRSQEEPCFWKINLSNR